MTLLHVKNQKENHLVGKLIFIFSVLPYTDPKHFE